MKISCIYCRNCPLYIGKDNTLNVDNSLIILCNIVYPGTKLVIDSKPNIDFYPYAWDINEERDCKFFNPISLLKQYKYKKKGFIDFYILKIFGKSYKIQKFNMTGDGTQRII